MAPIGKFDVTDALKVTRNVKTGKFSFVDLVLYP
jgi:hypothetical protein